MRTDKFMFLTRKETKKIELILGVLLSLALLLQPCLAVLTPDYSAMNQAGMPLDSPNEVAYGDTIAYGDYLFFNDTTWIPGSVGETISKWEWNLSNASNPAEFQLKTITNRIDRNVTFGPFLRESDWNLNLTVTSTDSSAYSTLPQVYHVNDDRKRVYADYDVIPAYDDRGNGNNNGTATFVDRSYTLLDPEEKITNWWWKYTDRSTNKQTLVSGVDYFIINMTNTIYDVNVTVENSQGNLVSTNGTTKIPPDNVYPLPNFTVVPKAGVGPLEIGIVDQAKSMVNYSVSDVPLAYKYTIGNATTANVFPDRNFNTKNLNITLQYPGIYHVIQNVTNSFGVSNETRVDAIAVYSKDGPIADFSASVREGLAPLNVTLIDQTIGVGPFTYDWKIGNASGEVGRSSKNNPQFSLQYPGSYWVNLTVADKYGSDFEHKSDYITVGAERYPRAAFTAVPMNGSYPLNVSFIDQSVLDPDLLATIGPANYTWTFDDGQDSHLQNPTHLFTAAGDYTVMMNITHGNMSSGPAIQTIHVYEPSDSGIDFTWVQEYGKTAYSVVLIPLGINSDWNVNWVVTKDGIEYEPVDLSTFTPRYDLPGIGIYSVTMTASKDGFTSRDITQQMDVFPNLFPNPDMTMQNKEAPFIVGEHSAFGYVGQPIQFWSNKSNSMEDSWFWDFGDNSSSPLRSPVHAYTAPGLYTVTLNASNVKGETSADASDELYPYHPYFSLENYNVWILNNIGIEPDASPRSGNAPLNVQFSANISVNGKLDAEPHDYIRNWQWFFGDGVASIEEKPLHQYNIPGDYLDNFKYYPLVGVRFINGLPGWHYYSLKSDPEFDSFIHVLPNTPIDAGFTYEEIDRNGTYGYSYKFMDTSRSYYGPIESWEWDFGDSSPDSTEPAPTHMFKEPGIYIVTLTVSDLVNTPVLFSKTITVSQDIQPTPIAAFNADVQTGLVPLTVQFSDQSRGDIKQWIWNFGDGQISHEQNPKHHYLLPGVYDVSLEVIDSVNGVSEVTKIGFIHVV